MGMTARLGRSAAAATAAALAVVAVVLVAPPADAAAYRYWTYWQGSTGAWAFATQGPATAVPADGAVEGWRFAVSTEAGTASDAPATAPDFASICAGTPAQDGSKRVALVVDTGPAGIAPAGEQPPAPVATCVVAAPDATGYEVLRSVLTVRVEDGLVCGIGGYPADECAPVLDEAEVAALEQAGDATAGMTAASDAATTAMDTGDDAATPADSGSPVATIVVAVLLIGAVAVSARRLRSMR